MHGTTAITAITAQNTVGVTAIHQIPPETILAQVRAVLADIRVDAVKVGMLGTAETVRAVAQALDELPAGTPVVVDPVMVAESGARLLDADAQRALIEEILPRASVLTPNLPEARALAGPRAVATGGEEDEVLAALARALLALGPAAVVITSGHRGRAVDLFVGSADAARLVEIEGPRHPDGAAHGSGCTHSSVLAAQLALGLTPLDAARTARADRQQAVPEREPARRGDRETGPVDVLGLERLRGRVRRVDWAAPSPCCPRHRACLP